ncbi:MAG: hypothetical protein U5N86_01125 [Planctomycetota bacterium]|nr:hypothetical protein [Planctomycetota bacterium]
MSSLKVLRDGIENDVEIAGFLAAFDHVDVQVAEVTRMASKSIGQLRALHNTFVDVHHRLAQARVLGLFDKDAKRVGHGNAALDESGELTGEVGGLGLRP